MVTRKKIDLFHRVRAFAGNQPSIKEKYIMLSNKIRTRIGHMMCGTDMVTMSGM